MNVTRLKEYFSEKLKSDGIYEIYCKWKRKGAHVFCAEVVGGNIKYFDPQSGNSNVSNYISKMNADMVGIIQIDNKLVNPKIKNLFTHN